MIKKYGRSLKRQEKIVKEDRERYLKSLCMKVVPKGIKSVTAFRNYTKAA